MKRCAGLVSAALFALGCAGGQTRVVDAVLSTDWQDDHGRSIEALRPAIEAARVPVNASVAVGVVPEGLVGRALDGGSSWTFAHAIDSRPAISGNVVAATGGGELFVLDARSGRKLWGKPAGGLLRGIGDDGHATVISLTQNGHASIVLVVEHTGTVIRQIEAAQVVGVPAVRGNYAFLPWTGQYVTVLNLTTGEEDARILFRERVSRALLSGESLYFGEQVLLAFDSNISRASIDRATYIAPPERPLPGEPTWFRSGFTPAPPVADAHDKVALTALPRPGGGLDGDVVVGTYFGYAFGMSAKTGATTWVHTHRGEILASSSFEGGAVLCDGAGKLTLLDSASGAEIGESSLGRTIQSCVLQTNGLKISRTAKPSKPLVAQLAQALDSTGSELVAIQKVFVADATTIDDARATKALVDLVCDARTSPDLAHAAGAALLKRRTGSEFLVAALDRHFDYLNQVRPPPVGVLADGLAAMKETRAAPALAAHLLDPANSIADVRRVAAALAVLATGAEAPALRDFFGLYRTNALESDAVVAVTAVARALLRVGTSEDRAALKDALEDPFTTDGVRAGLQELFDGAAAGAPEDHGGARLGGKNQAGR